MGEEVSLIDLKVGQAVTLERLDNMQRDVNEKHEQNRNSIHDMRAVLQKVVDDIWKLKLKLAGYAAVGGAIAASVAKLIEHVLK